MTLPPPVPGQVPPPPTSLPEDTESELRSNLMLMALIVLLVLLMMVALPALFDWSGRPVTSELNGRIDLVTGSLLTILVDVIRRAAGATLLNKNKDKP